MKKRFLAILLAAAVFTAVMPSLLMPETALAASDFKFIDTHKNRLGGWANWGRCYFEYEINGKLYISDKNADQAANARAWSLMEPKDKKKIVELFTGRKEIRDSQFGEEISAQIIKYSNDKSKWTDAAEKLARKIEKKYMADDLILHYSDRLVPGKNVSYYEYAMDFYNMTYGDNLYASLAVNSDGRADIYAMIHKQQQAAECMREGKAIYDELLQTKRLALQTATQAASGELISLIMDKAFMPKIAESTIKDVAKEVWSLLDKGLSITDTLKDKIFNTKGSQTVSFDAAEEVFKVLNDRSERYEKSCRMLYQKADSIMYEVGQKAPEIEAKIKADKAAAQRRKNDLEMELLRIKNPPYDSDMSYSQSVRESIEAIEKWPDYTIEEEALKKERLKEVKASVRSGLIKMYTEYINDYKNWQDTWETTLRNLVEDGAPVINGEPVTNHHFGGFMSAENLKKTEANINATKSFMNSSISYMSVHNDAAKRALEEETERSLKFANRKEDILEARDILYNKGGGYVDFVDETGLFISDNRISFTINRQRLYADYDFTTTKQYSFMGEAQYLETIAGEIEDVGFYEDMYKNHADNLDDAYKTCKSENERYTELTRKLADEYIGAQANYDNAMRFYEADYNEIKRRIEALPTYVKNQPVKMLYGNFGVSVYAPYFEAKDNLELSEAFFGVYGAQREALGRKYADELRPILKAIQEYKEDMDEEYQKAVYYKKQMSDAYTELCYGGWHYDECGIGILYPDLGTGSEGSSGITISVPSELPLAPKRLMFTTEEEDRMQALKLLYEDFSGMSYYQARVNFLTDRLKDCKGQIYREAAANNGESATLREITAEYHTIVWEYIRTCSWLGVGPTGDEDPEFEENLAEIVGRLGKMVFVRGISKGAQAKLFDDNDDYDLTVTEGETGRLYASVYPSDATDKTIVWESENTDIAIVFGDGTVKGCSAGEVKIKAHPADSIKFAVDQYGNALEIDKNGNAVIPEASDSEPVGFTYKLTDDAGNYVTAEIEYTIKVEPSSLMYGIGGVAIFNAEGTELDNVPLDSGFRVSVPVMGESGGVVILAVYDMDGCMTEMYEAEPVEGTAEFEVENEDGRADSVKAFLWNSIGDMTPITKAAGFNWITKAPDEDIEYTDLPDGLEYADIFDGENTGDGVEDME